METRQTLSVKEAAKLWGVTPTTVRRWVREGMVRVEPVHARRWVVVLTEVGHGVQGQAEEVGAEACR
jgi:excisionase family DNA binding protein